MKSFFKKLGLYREVEVVKIKEVPLATKKDFKIGDEVVVARGKPDCFGDILGFINSKPIIVNKWGGFKGHISYVVKTKDKKGDKIEMIQPEKNLFKVERT